MYRRCPGACRGTGVVWDDDEDEERECPHCDGDGMEAIESQIGVSVCASLEDLRSYLAERAPYLEDCVLLELEGSLSEDTDVDTAYGAILIVPSSIVRTLDISVL